MYKSFQDRLYALEYPERKTKPMRGGYVSNAAWGEALDVWELQVAQRQAEMQEYHKQVAQIENEFKLALLKDLGIENHPKAELLWQKAWEKGSSYGLQEVEQAANDLVELLR